MKLKNLLLASSILLSGASQAVALPISGGPKNGIMVSKDNKVYAWGMNEFVTNKKVLQTVGEKNTYIYVADTVKNYLGLDVTVADFQINSVQLTPALVNTKGKKIVQADICGETILGISDKGILYYWGKDRNSESIVSDLTPFLCGETIGLAENGEDPGNYLGKVKKVACSPFGFLALLENGTVAYSSDFSPVVYARDINGNILNNIIDISAGDNTYSLLTSEGLVYYIGCKIFYNNLFPETPTDYFTPVILDDTNMPLTNIVNIAEGYQCAFAVTKDGHAYGWGEGGYGGCTASGKQMSHPNAKPIIAGEYTKFSGDDLLTNVKQISSGLAYGLAVTFDGHVLYWGANDKIGGKLSNDPDDISGVHKPKLLTYENGSIVDDAIAVECGENFGFVINNKNQYFAFGMNNLGQCGVVSDSSEFCRLHPMSINFELPVLCPSVRLLDDTIMACPNGSSAFEALTSSVKENNDYYLNWYLNDKKLKETSNICIVNEEGEYKVVMTPTDSLCATTSDYAFASEDNVIIKPLDNNIIIEDSSEIDLYNLTFKLTSAEESEIYIYNNEECTNALDTLTIQPGDNEIVLPGSLVSIDGDKANIWVKEANKETILFPQDGIMNNSVSKYHGMYLKTAKNATLHSFDLMFRDFVNGSEVSVTPIIYHANPDANNQYTNLKLIHTGKKQTFISSNIATKYTVVCDFNIPNNGTYVLGMEFDGNVTFFVTSIPELTGNDVLFKDPITDINNYGIEWVGSSANSYTSANPAIENCFFNLVFNNIETVSCGAVKITTNLETSLTDCINVTNVENKSEGEKYDILGRKVINVQPNKIYIQNGKKYIINNK